MYTAECDGCTLFGCVGVSQMSVAFILRGIYTSASIALCGAIHDLVDRFCQFMLLHESFLDG